MNRLLRSAFVPGMMAVIVLTSTATSKAQWLGFSWGWNYPSYYSSYYSPYYSSYYTPSYSYYSPSYTTSYVPTYTTSYTPSVTYYAGSSACCDSGCCGVQTSYSVSSACCSPCASCVSCNSCNTCCSPCTSCGTCCDGNCDLADSSTQTPTPAKSSPSRNPTFIDEPDPADDKRYDNPPAKGTGDGFAPRTNDPPDPLDETFGTSSAGGRETLRFKVPQSTPAQQPDARQNPVRVKSQSEPEYPLLKLDEKITSRSMPERTRLVERRSWKEPVIARNVTRDAEEINIGWVPLPAPTQVVQK